MNRIILAYAPENITLANNIDRSLNRIGIPFEHANADVADQIASAGEPVLLLVTDNFLVNKACLEGLLPVLQALAADKRLFPVLADGIDQEGKVVETHIDRMANALHYMKYWQDVWLALSDRHQQLEGAEKAALTAELDATRGIANQMGDLIGTLREVGYMTLEQFEANDFEAFFQRFDLLDWHGQYKRLVAQAMEKNLLEETVHLPEMPVAGGLLTPEPVLDQQLPSVTFTPEPIPIDHYETAAESAVTQDPDFVASTAKTAIEQDAKDAWFWIEKGHMQRGLDLFQIALEQYPENDWLKDEFERATQKANLATTASRISAPETPDIYETPETTTAPKASDEAKSYDLMGEMAVERGDYLFAKYCWDRVMEIDPNFPNIYRKLGLMTTEHLHDYQETALIYLRKALEINPNDAAVKATLKAAAEGDKNRPKAVAADSLQEDEASWSKTETVPAGLAPIPISSSTKPLVLITGATSGIGRATAEIFARNGYRLILTGRRAERLLELKNTFSKQYGVEVWPLPFDIRDAEAVEAALSSLPESFREIDILVNNAGLAKGLAPIHEGNLDHWEAMIDTNLKGLLYVTRLVSKGMVQRHQGHIINVCSSAGKEAYPNGNVYCATKFAVDALTKSMRFDLHAHNIRVSQVSPGHVEETEFAITRFDGDAERAKIYDDFQPLKSSDVADAIYFMATRPAHVNIQDIQLFATQQASSTVINRSGR